MFGWPELNKKNYKKVTVANQRSFFLFEGILGFSIPSIILADLLGNIIGGFRSVLVVSVGAFHLGKKTGNFGGSKSGISDW